MMGTAVQYTAAAVLVSADNSDLSSEDLGRSDLAEKKKCTKFRFSDLPANPLLRCRNRGHLSEPIRTISTYKQQLF